MYIYIYIYMCVCVCVCVCISSNRNSAENPREFLFLFLEKVDALQIHYAPKVIATDCYHYVNLLFVSRSLWYIIIH